MRFVWVPFGLLAIAIPAPSRAEEPPRPADAPPSNASDVDAPATPSPSASGAETDRRAAWETAPATHRGGFTAGILAGLAFGTVHGYPNDFDKIDVPAYRSATSGVGSSLALYLGGALTDWFTFGLGFGTSSYQGSELISRGTLFIFHLEAFPAFARGGRWRDAGLFADFGTGVATVKARAGGGDLATSGALSIVGIGAFFEPWRLAGHLAVGPYASWQYQQSDSMARHVGSIGLRAAFYGGP
jgi:hypothetical protein